MRQTVSRARSRPLVARRADWLRFFELRWRRQGLGRLVVHGRLGQDGRARRAPDADHRPRLRRRRADGVRHQADRRLRRRPDQGRRRVCRTSTSRASRSSARSGARSTSRRPPTLEPDLIVADYWPVEKGYSGMEDGVEEKSKKIAELAPVVGPRRATRSSSSSRATRSSPTSARRRRRRRRAPRRPRPSSRPRATPSARPRRPSRA